jgi:hypothetical protein
LKPPATTGAVWTETVLHLFDARPSGGLPVLDSNGAVYGTTTHGGGGRCGKLKDQRGCGTVYQASPPVSTGGTWTYSTIFKLSRKKAHAGADPANIVLLGDELYGITFNPGHLFRLERPSAPGGAWKETTVFGFNHRDEGPVGIVAHAHRLYGASEYGGHPHLGTVFVMK